MSKGSRLRKEHARKLRNKQLRIKTEAMRRIIQSNAYNDYQKKLAEETERHRASDPVYMVNEFNTNCNNLSMVVEELEKFISKTKVVGNTLLHDEQHRFDNLDMSDVYSCESDLEELKKTVRSLMEAVGDVQNHKDDYVYAMGVLTEKSLILAEAFTEYARITGIVTAVANDWKKIYEDPTILANYQKDSDAYEMVKDTEAAQSSSTEQPTPPAEGDMVTESSAKEDSCDKQ